RAVVPLRVIREPLACELAKSWCAPVATDGAQLDQLLVDEIGDDDALAVVALIEVQRELHARRAAPRADEVLAYLRSASFALAPMRRREFIPPRKRKHARRVATIFRVKCCAAAMSAFGGKADMAWCSANVCF